MTTKLVILGAGKMGSALAEGLLAASWCRPEELTLIAPSTESRASLEKRFGSSEVLPSLELATLNRESDALLSVKPDYAESVARQAGAAGIMRILSVVAGISSARLEAVLPNGARVIRSMPNTPVLVRKGASAIAGGSNVTSEDLAWAESILGAVGVVVRVGERHIDVVTGLSGPMPAYLYLVVEALIDAGVQQGLTREVARDLVTASFEGSGALLAASEMSAAQLREQVTSPGGTTAAGLRTLESHAVRAAFLDAVAVATERSRQLGR